ncbi:hypothetical protein C8R47DRAFT_1229118 [Mycena vitilis]|nr:hypothetical protein C8R47DRAFT_1229118 [Mycena vitilis]
MPKAASEMRTSKARTSKTLSQARSAFAVNSDFGYLNSQVPDKDAFRHFVGAQAGEETQLELEEYSTPDPAPRPGVGGAHVLGDKSASVKIEKENDAESIVSIAVSPAAVRGSKRARHEASAVKAEKECDPVLREPGRDAAMRITQLENEVALLRAQLRTNQDATDRYLDGLQREWENVRAVCLGFKDRVGGLGVRMERVEGHIDEIVEHLPAHHGWKSEVGSDFDLDTTIEVEDGSQPVEEPWWDEGSQPVEEPWWDEGVKKESEF